MRVTGKNHWPWLVENFARLVEEGNAEAEELSDAASSANSVTRYLQLDKDDEMVCGY